MKITNIKESFEVIKNWRNFIPSPKNKSKE